MGNLDGTQTKDDLLVPFDAHDKVIRASNEDDHSEYPKAVDHVEAPDGHLEPIVARDAAHESELEAAKKGE